MKRQTKLSPEQQQQQQSAEQQQARQSSLNFATAEEVLRYDAAQTAVPPGIAQKLQQSTASLPPPPRSWWKKLFKQ